VLSTALSESGAPVVATSVRQVDRRPRTGKSAPALADALGLDLDVALERASATGKAGEVVDVPVIAAGSAVRRLLLVGTGDGGAGDLRRAGAALARRAAGAQRVATDTVLGLDADTARAHVEGLLLAAYAFGPPPRGTATRKEPVGSIDLHLPGRQSAPVRAAVDMAQVTARAVHLARDLANTPSGVKDPTWLARQAREHGRRHALKVTVLDEKDLARDGFGGIVAVGMGSARPPRLIELRYLPDGAARSAPHVVLVGKGITFDSGGLSLKPREAMLPMKTDMAAGERSSRR